MRPDFDKYTDKLVPVVIQDNTTQQVLMLGYMNEEAYDLTLQTRKVTFYSRSRQQLWVKGETSGNFLKLATIKSDCDNDSLLVTAIPDGPTCHTGATSCFGEPENDTNFLYTLEQIIQERKDNPANQSYTSSLFAKGINKIAQKVGEEAVELVIEAKDDNDDLFINEASDLVFHLLILLKAKGKSLEDVVHTLKGRHKKG